MTAIIGWLVLVAGGGVLAACGDRSSDKFFDQQTQGPMITVKATVKGKPPVRNNIAALSASPQVVMAPPLGEWRGAYEDFTDFVGDDRGAYLRAVKHGFVVEEGENGLTITGTGRWADELSFTDIRHDPPVLRFTVTGFSWTPLPEGRAIPWRAELVHLDGVLRGIYFQEDASDTIGRIQKAAGQKVPAGASYEIIDNRGLDADFVRVVPGDLPDGENGVKPSSGSTPASGPDTG